MAFEIIFHRNAEKGLKALKSRPALMRRVMRFLDELASNPYTASAKKLLGEWEGCYSYHAGPIRVIYEIHKQTLKIYVLDIGPRGDIY